MAAVVPDDDARRYKVTSHGTKYRILVRPLDARRSNKRSLLEFYGYESENAAKNDVQRLKDHYKSESKSEFVKVLNNNSNKNNKVEEAKYKKAYPAHSQRGKVAQINLRALAKEYHAYTKLMRTTGEPPLSKAEWKSTYYEATGTKDRLLRLFANNPTVRHEAILLGFLSGEDAIKLESLNSSLAYFEDRKKLLLDRNITNSLSLTLLRDSFYNGTSHKLLMKASIQDDIPLLDALDLTDDDVFTFESISKNQLQKVNKQCAVVEKFYTRLERACGKEILLVDKILEKMNSPKTTFKDAITIAKDSWHELKRQVALGMILQRHRASSDARLLQSTLKALRQQPAAA